MPKRTKKIKRNNGAGPVAQTGPAVLACNNKNPLVRGGTSQLQRHLSGLKSDYIQVDEKHFTDWIVFAGSFAKYLNYYDRTNTVNGNWQPFFNSDISATLALAAIQNIDEYKQAINENFAVLKSDDFSGNTTLLRQTFGSLFSALLTLTKAIDQYSFKFQNEDAYRSTLLNVIKSKLQPTLKKLLGYYKGALALNLVDEVEDNSWKIFDTTLLKASDVIAGGLSANWADGNMDWSTYYTSVIKADTSIYNPTLPDGYPPD